MIQFPLCDKVQQATSGVVPRTNNFTLPGMSMDGGSKEMVTLPFQKMIYGGLMGLNLSSYLRPNCITGNCSVDSFWTIGYSSECFDASDQLKSSSSQSGTPEDTYWWPKYDLSIVITYDLPEDDGGPTASPLLVASSDDSTWWGSQIRIMLTNQNATNDNTTVHAVMCNLTPSLQKYSSEVVSITFLITASTSALVSRLIMSSNSLSCPRLVICSTVPML